MRVQFGPFHLDAENACVWRGTEALHLTPKAFAVLSALLARPGRLVTKDELWHSVWPGIAVSDAALTVCIREIRQRLQDDAKTPRFIETVHRRGYRLIASTARDTRTAMAPPVSAGGRTAPLVGRDAELARLHEHLARAAGGERQFVFVTGGPGIGKTRLVDAFLTDVAKSEGACIARGVCIEYRGSGEPYLPVLDAIGRLCRGSEAKGALAVLGRYAPTWLHQMPGLASAEGRETSQTPLPVATRGRMLREMADALEALSADRPLVLAFEDLQWSDHATLDLINWLAHRRELSQLFPARHLSPRRCDRESASFARRHQRACLARARRGDAARTAERSGRRAPFDTSAPGQRGVGGPRAGRPRADRRKPAVRRRGGGRAGAAGLAGGSRRSLAGQARRGAGGGAGAPESPGDGRAAVRRIGRRTATDPRSRKRRGPHVFGGSGRRGNRRSAAPRRGSVLGPRPARPVPGGGGD